jgi:hypothetical protein
MNIGSYKLEGMRLIVFISIISFLSCSKEEASTIDPSFGERIVSIRHEHMGLPSKDTFLYEDTRLQTIVESTKEYHFKYENERLIEIQSIGINDSTPHAIDSLTYNNEGQLTVIECYSSRNLIDYTLDYVYEFEYDLNRQINRRVFSKGKQKRIISVVEYEWEKNNIKTKSKYDALGNLQGEMHFEHDNKRNFLSQDPRYLIDLQYWNTNNVVRTEIHDYTGFIDYICYDCKTTYKYNLDDYPVVQKLQWGSKYYIEYQQ